MSRSATTFPVIPLRYRSLRTFLFTLVALLCRNVAAADDGSPLLTDRSGDGRVEYVGFGDSITFGVGDGTAPGGEVAEVPFTDGEKGYVPRVRDYLGVAAQNLGVPGELLAEDGLLRFVDDVSAAGGDVIGILEGVNDANEVPSETRFAVNLQRAVNVARFSGVEPVVMTIPPPCCDKAGLVPITDRFSDVVEAIAERNDVALVDLRRAWRTSCGGAEGRCDLYNLPEGLHPNTKGYDVVAQTVAATLLGIDVFAEGGPGRLADAIGVPESAVAVRPDRAGSGEAGER